MRFFWLFFVVFFCSASFALYKIPEKLHEDLFCSIVESIYENNFNKLKRIITQNNNPDLKYLLNRFTPKGLTPLYIALVFPKNFKITKFLLAHGADPNLGILYDFRPRAKRKSTLYTGWTAAHIAIRYSDSKVLELLAQNN